MMNYTLGLIRQGNRILLLNRETPVWMGCWNGIGGKIEQGEQPRASMQREIQEETGLQLAEVLFKGILTWSTMKGEGFGGLFLYFAEISEDLSYPTPVKTPEGLLDWKEIDWILHPDNQGVASNLLGCLRNMLGDPRCFHYHGYFSGNRMVEEVSSPIEAELEADEVRRRDYLNRYMEEGCGRPFLPSQKG